MYSLHPVLIDIFPYGTMTKATKCAYQSNKCNIDFLLVLQCLTRNPSFLVLFIATTHNNSKYGYHFLTFEVLKYSYQKWMEGVSFSGSSNISINSKPSISASLVLVSISEHHLCLQKKNTRHYEPWLFGFQYLPHANKISQQLVHA